MKRIGIVGSRRRNALTDFEVVSNKFTELYSPGDWIVSGGCPTGADSFAYRLHKKYNIPYLEFPADWENKGRSAGFQRNSQIAEHSDILIACVALDRTGGTEDTIKKFLKKFAIDAESFLYLV